MQTKPKRPRKPLQPIKVVHQPKTIDSGRKSPDGAENGSKQPANPFNGREFSQFYLDEVRSRR